MRATFALAVALAALVAVPAAHEAAPAGAKIVYESYSDGDFEIYATDPDTHAVLQLTDNSYEDSSPTPSPDGTKVAFYSDSGTAVVNTDGTGRRTLTGCVGYNLSWAPDSSSVACETDDEGIAVVQADGSGSHRILSGVEASAPSWSPDGTTIAYIAPDGVWTMNPAGGDRRHLTSHPADYLTVPTWSPDSKSIVFVSNEASADRSDLYLLKADGSELARLATNIFEDHPAWSPNGSRIAYTGYRNKALVVYTIAPDGSGRSVAAAGAHGEVAFGPTWSPDGEQLAYIRGRFPGYAVDGDVFTVDRQGVQRQLTFAFPTGGSADSASWANGALANGTPPPVVDSLTLPKRRQLGGVPVLATVIGNGAAAAAPQQAECGTFFVWHPGVRTRRINPCADTDLLLDIGVAGDRVAWITAQQSHTEFPQYLQVADGNGRPQVISTADADPESGAGDYIYYLHGGGSLLAFNFWHMNRKGQVTSIRTWRVLRAGARGAQKCPASTGDVAPGTSKRRCLRLRGGDGMKLVSASEGMFVGIAHGRAVVVRPDGRVAQRGPVLPHLVSARWQNKRLILLTSEFLQIGGKRVELPAYPGMPEPQLLSGFGNYVLYWRGAVHLLRLSDGRDRVLRAVGQAPPVAAELGPKGLFYEYNQLHTKKPGRILFVPRSQLNALLKAG